MKCINFRIRTLSYQKYMYCMQHKKKIEFSDCKNCEYKKYKEHKELKKKSKKQKKLEDKRFSIITDNLKVCYICKQKPKEDLHEVFGGCNRRKSIEWGLVIPVCRECHSKWDIDSKLRIETQEYVQQIFEKQYSHELFMTEFKKNYIKEK